MPMTLKQIVSYSTQDRVRSAREIAIIKVKPLRDRRGVLRITAQAYTPFNTKTWEKVANPNKYDLEITALTPKTTSIMDGPVRVACSCPDFWATWEVALTHKGAAIIQYSNGEHPEVRNPNLRPGMCKHLLGLTGHILRSKL